MINLKDCIELGVLSRPHGIKGHIVLKLTGFSFEDIEEMGLVYIIVDGLPVPFFIEEFSERSQNTLLLKLEDVDSEYEARKYSKSLVYLDREVVSQGNTNSHINAFHFIGYRVIDEQHGEIGILDTLLEYEQNPVLRILKGHKEILVPFRDEFLLKIDDKKREIHIKCPKGLIDLYV